jgi:hypothetical protein
MNTGTVQRRHAPNIVEHNMQSINELSIIEGVTRSDVIVW